MIYDRIMVYPIDLSHDDPFGLFACLFCFWFLLGSFMFNVFFRRPVDTGTGSVNDRTTLDSRMQIIFLN